MTPNSRQGASIGPQVIFGIAVVVFGLLLTASNLGIGRVTSVLQFAPLLLSVLGVALLLEKGSSGSRRFVGIALVIGGVWQTAVTAFGFRYYINDYWPLALVALGVFLVMRSINPRSGGEDYTGVGSSATDPMAGSVSPGSPYNHVDGSTTLGPSVVSARDESISIFAFMGGVTRNVVSPAFRRGNATAVMGGVVLDFRKSTASGGEAVIECFAMWGGIEVKVPPDWQVVNEITPIMGGVDDRATQTQPIRHRLVLKGVVFMGGVEIKS